MSSPSYTLRGPMLPASRRVRAYFAPVARDSELPSVFDPSAQFGFPLDSPPAPWIDLGWIENFKRSAATEIVPIAAGAKSAPVALARKNLSARVEFDFREWGKLQMALASGSQHMNVLVAPFTVTLSASGGYEPNPAVPTLAGSTATELVVPPGDLLSFSVGNLVAVDLDYAGQTGYVGSGIAGAYVKNPADVRNDVNYIRRVTFNVGRIAAKTTTSIKLAQPLLGGAPPANASIQQIFGFVDREGGSFFQEWSAIFVVPEESGGRIVFHYPRLQPGAAASETAFEITAPIEARALHASFIALPTIDPNDGEQVLSYRSYFPAMNAAVY